MARLLDPHQLEQRTQAIGQELFAAARRQHAHLSVLNRWSSDVLSWCLADAAVKGAVLRFIDVLPSLTTPRAIAEHIREYFPTRQLHLPAALWLGASFARTGLLTRGGLAALVRQVVEQVARQFIADFQTDGARHVIRVLAAHGATTSLDVLGEQVLNEAEADQYLARCQQLVRDSLSTYASLEASTTLPVCGARTQVSIKPSALTPRFDPISPRQSVERAARRLLPLCELAAERGASLTLDMEQHELRDLTLALAQHVLEHQRPLQRLSLGVVLQAYLCDADEILERVLDWLAVRQQTLTVRLVKGAYWDYEVARAQQCRWPLAVYQDKAQTDRAFERLTRRLLEAHPLVTTAVASHNVRSIAHAMAVAELLEMPKTQLEFQLLYGMGEALQAAIVERGYPVRIYTPIGELIPGMAYLVRRILENTANESFLRQDLFGDRSAEELLAPPHGERAAQTAPSDNAQGWPREPLRDFSRESARAHFTHAVRAARDHRGTHAPLLIGSEVMTTDQTLTIVNPAEPDDVLGTVSCAGVAEVERAVEWAHRVQSVWARTPIVERTACLRRTAALLRQRRDELAAWECLEVGKTWREADVDVVEAIEYLEYYSEQMLQMAQGRPLLQVPGERNTYRYQPRGVAAVIAPWNFPAAIPMGMVSAALVSGNPVILKPAEQSSLLAMELVQLLRSAGVPEGVVQYLPGRGEEAGQRLVEHPQVQTILFTGSKAVGCSMLEAAARVPSGQRCLKRVIVEMGGKNALIIDADADLDAAIQGALHSAFGYAGQKCSAASRLIVHRAIFDRFLARFIATADRLVVGDPTDPATDLGPLIDAEAQRRLAEAIARAQASATLAYRYPDHRMPARGYFVGPTIVTDVDPTDRLATEELFGPLLCVFRAQTFEEALALANATDYALTGGVYSRSPAHLALAQERFDVGNLYLNRPITGAMVGRQPFGGHRLSGFGTKAGGPDYLLQLVIPQTICTNTTRHGMPLE